MTSFPHRKAMRTTLTNFIQQVSIGWWCCLWAGAMQAVGVAGACTPVGKANASLLIIGIISRLKKKHIVIEVGHKMPVSQFDMEGDIWIEPFKKVQKCLFSTNYPSPLGRAGLSLSLSCSHTARTSSQPPSGPDSAALCHKLHHTAQSPLPHLFKLVKCSPQN